MKKYLIIFIFFLLTGCKWNDANLGNNYYYLNKYEATDVGYPGGAIIYKSTQEYLYSDVKIRGNVIEVKFNDKYILAKQKPINSKKSNNKINYFIINKINDHIYGPCSADSVKVLMKKFNVKLKL